MLRRLAGLGLLVILGLLQRGQEILGKRRTAGLHRDESSIHDVGFALRVRWRWHPPRAVRLPIATLRTHQHTYQFAIPGPKILHPGSAGGDAEALIPASLHFHSRCGPRRTRETDQRQRMHTGQMGRVVDEASLDWQPRAQLS